jgi:hypothetical protein
MDLTIWQKNVRLLILTPSYTIVAGALWLGLMLVYETFFGGGAEGYATLQILTDFLQKIYPYA